MEVTISRKQVLDTTQESSLPLLVRFAVPLILGSLFQPLYSFVDTAISSSGRNYKLFYPNVPKTLTCQYS